MPYQIENRMVVDAEWNEIEYGTKHKTLYERQRETYDEAEREYKKHEYLI